MQHLSSGVFQELQQQIERQAEPKSRRSRASPERGRGVDPQSSAPTRETSVPFSCTHCQPSPTTSSSSPFFREAVRSSSSSEASSLRHGAGSREGAPPPTTQNSVERSGSGSRATSTSSRPSSTEAVPSQFVGRSVGANAYLLADTSESIPQSVKQYQLEQKANSTAQLRSLLDPILRDNPTDASSLLPDCLRKELIPESSDSRRSSASSPASTSSSTLPSDASSVAYVLRRRRADTRLLKESSKPLQHLLQRASNAPHSEEAKPSLSVLKPNLVEEKAAVHASAVTATTGFPSASPIGVPLTSLPEVPSRNSSTKKPLRKVRTIPTRANAEPIVPSLSRTRAISTTSNHISPPPSVILPSPLRTSRRDSVNPAQFEAPPIVVEESGKNDVGIHSAAKSTHSNVRRSGSHHRHHNRQYHDVTPPEDDPGISPFRHSDHYFNTFPPDAMWSKEFVPAYTPLHQGVPTVTYEGQFWHESEPSALLPATSLKEETRNDNIMPKPEKRKKSSIFSFFRKTIPQHNVFETSPERDYQPSSSSQQPPVPGIKFSNSEGDLLKPRQPSSIPKIALPPYFMRPRFHRGASSATLSSSSQVSPLAKIDDEEGSHFWRNATARRSRYSSSDHLSPMATSRSRPVLSPHPPLESFTDENDDDDDVSPGRPVPRLAPDVTANIRTNIEKLPNVDHETDEDKHRTPGSVVFSFRPAESRSSTSVQELTSRKRPSFLKGILSNIVKSVPSVQAAERKKSLESKHDQRPVDPVLRSSKPNTSQEKSKSFSSIQKLGNKSPQPITLVRKTNGVNDAKNFDQHHRHLSETFTQTLHAFDNDLTVTEFWQTPFAQRYANSQRAAQQQVRAFVEEAMNEDNDESNEMVLGFETDVPDHLPNSPLCPLNPAHRSGGKAICPQHGRWKKGMPCAAGNFGRPALAPARVKRANGAGIAKKDGGGNKRLKIVYDTRAEAKARTASMGSDGTKSPNQAVEELRGRKRERTTHGSARKRGRLH